jgi:hypothetical protein
MTEFETAPEGWVEVTLTGDEEFPVVPWHAEQAAGPPYPDYWVDCPACEGDGCGLCYGIGRRHPKPASWTQDYLDATAGELYQLNRMLNDPDLRFPARRATEWMIASAEVAAKLVDRWYREDAGGGEDLSRVEASPRAEGQAAHRPGERSASRSFCTLDVWRAAHVFGDPSDFHNPEGEADESPSTDREVSVL